MTKYLISFDEGTMRISEEDLPAVTEASVTVVRAAMDAGVWVFGGGLTPRQGTSVVATDGTVTDAPPAAGKQYLGGFSIVDVPTREEALEWAAKIAVACRCAQEVREFMPEPDDL
ncbi:YciI family protein [Amycolatopsis alba]|uniref:YCII-related domain-containing protein n=1 Tax=Amycolatopsis alba DSM 44262 TaxID=1125972 RepID=A0A229R8X6_AMYAL|nr:YciI family protein [Amycolatopsis alba]OXM43086.1 hypothetical protein CFP75_40010 [Amycolatopsis alba DSM 44262]